MKSSIQGGNFGAYVRGLVAFVLVPVDVDLDAERKPRLDFHVDEAELSVEEVV